ncbi:MAG: hypothetical protein KKD07_01580 [Candidatus Omnitrophica bacterium]|nr:hypothetical protein [Candidatus Omnitrophota bacterium]MBU1997354.1 hypothetical protein [Candidatus Omnitrophota bacterium]MBU4333112.1 hypothetical protein [Candidatus Omnitrophota bacterium]
MFKKLCSVLMLLSFVCFFANVSLSQEMDQYDISFGTIVSVSDSEIVINEEDLETENVTQVSFMTDPEMVLENFEMLDELGVGTFVEIFYEIKGDTKVINSITITTREELEEEMNEAELEMDVE